MYIYDSASNNPFW